MIQVPMAQENVEVVGVAREPMPHLVQMIVGIIQEVIKYV